MYEPIPGNIIFNSLKDKGAIIMAVNARTTVGVAEGIFRAAKDTDSAVIFEIARSECNLDRGYTGLLPSDYAEHIKKAAQKTEFDAWALHADHITVKKGTPEDIESTKQLIDAQIDAGFTSFAIVNKVAPASSTNTFLASLRLSIYAAFPFPFCASFCISASL